MQGSRLSETEARWKWRADGTDVDGFVDEHAQGFGRGAADENPCGIDAHPEQVAQCLAEVLLVVNDRHGPFVGNRR